MTGFIRSKRLSLCDRIQDMPAIPLTTAWLAIAFVADAAYVVFKPRENNWRDLIVELCSNWRPLNFLFVSLLRIVYAALSISKIEHSCNTSSDYKNQLIAIEILTIIVLLTFAFSALCNDYDSRITRTLRKSSYFASLLGSLLDLLCFFVWGSSITLSFTNRILSVNNWSFNIADNLNSCMIAQVILLSNWFYVSYLSVEGNACTFPSLRFSVIDNRELDGLNGSSTSNAPAQVSQTKAVQVKVSSNACFRLYRWFLLLRRKHLEMSRVFIIPCNKVACNLPSKVDEMQNIMLVSEMELQRPLFRLNCFPDVLLHFAQTYGIWYDVLMFTVFLSCLALSQLEKTGTGVLVLNIVLAYLLLGYLSCKRYNIDVAAAKKVALSFRFVSIVISLLFLNALNIRTTFYLAKQTPQQWASHFLMIVGFVLCLLFDCSPNLPVRTQLAITTSWCVTFGLFTRESLGFSLSFVTFSADNLDCFLNIGDYYSLCTATAFPYIYRNLFFLMLQFLMCRIVFPGISIFVDSSVIELTHVVQTPVNLEVEGEGRLP